MSKKNNSLSSYSLNKLFSTELRFFVMTILAMYDEVDFNFLKKELKATDGNLSIQLRKLEEAEYLTSKKEFVDRKPKTTYAITSLGLEELQKHIETISSFKKILK